MSWTGKTLTVCAPYLAKLPKDLHFVTNDVGPDNLWLTFYVSTQEKRRIITNLFSGSIWKKEWDGQSFNYETNHTIGDCMVRIRIDGVTEKPLESCTPITKKKSVTRSVPTGYKDVTEEEEVIVGWDCGGTIIGGDDETD